MYFIFFIILFVLIPCKCAELKLKRSDIKFDSCNFGKIVDKAE